MKTLTRGLGLALVSLGMLSVTGCGPDNETEAQNAAKVAGDPGAPNPNAKVAAPAAVPAQTQAGHFQESTNSQSKAGGYPGARR